jgi:hypothetical protein
MKVIFCAMFLSMVIFFVLAVTGCQSTQGTAMREGSTCSHCTKPATRNYYQELCPGCTPYYVTYAYPGYGVTGCSTCTRW